MAILKRVREYIADMLAEDGGSLNVTLVGAPESGVDVSDRAARLLGVVTGAAGAALAKASQLPAALGRLAASASTSIALSTEDKAALDTVATEATLVGVSAQLPESLGAKAASGSLSVVQAQAGAPTYGQKQAPTGTPVALGSSASFDILTVYADSSIDVYVGPDNTVTSTSHFILRAGGPPLVLRGPINRANVFVKGASGSPIVGYVGQ